MGNKKINTNKNAKYMVCMTCGRTTNSADFYKSKRDEYIATKKCPICKKCLMNMIIDENENVSEIGFKKVLSYLDLPFIPSLFVQVSETGKLSTMIGDYIRRLNTRADIKNGDFRFADSIRFETEHTIKSEMQREVITDEMRIMWGNGYSYDEYKFLQRYYDDLTYTYDSSTPMLKNNFKNMARTQLNADKSLIEGDAGSYDKFMKILSMLMGDSNIKPIQEKNKESDDTFGCLIDWIEQTEPIPEASEEFKDVDNIMKYVNLGFVKHFARMCGMNNDPLEEDLIELERYGRVDLDG